MPAFPKVKVLIPRVVKPELAAEPGPQIPSFDGAGWLNGAKILKCKDDPTLLCLKGGVKTIQVLWNGARLEVVDRADMPAFPKAKVLIPQVVKPELALPLLQRQNIAVPTSDWKVLFLSKPVSNNTGQYYILRINKAAEDILYPRVGKMV